MKRETMRKILRGAAGFVAAALLPAFGASATEWPQIAGEMQKIAAYFTYPRGGVFTAGLVFGEASPVRAADKGKVLIQIKESQNAAMFDSPLGNALVTINGESLMSVYGNLDARQTADKAFVEEGEFLGESGSSGWQEGTALEYQVADTQSRTLINPLILLPKQPEPEPQSKRSSPAVPRLRNLTLVSKGGVAYKLDTAGSVPAGSYSLYFDRFENQPPFRITVLLNGKETESIAFNMLKKNGSRLAIDGKRNYTYDAVFAARNQQLLATLTLNRGKALIVVQTHETGNGERSYIYNVDVR